MTRTIVAMLAGALLCGGTAALWPSRRRTAASEPYRAAEHTVPCILRSRNGPQQPHRYCECWCHALGHWSPEDWSDEWPPPGIPREPTRLATRAELETPDGN